MRFSACLALAALLAGAPAWAQEKGGMPDLAQIDQTCLPTSTANLMIWFGQHGYPKLILPGATDEERADHTIHMLMADTGARYDVGTEMEEVTRGIEAYVHRAGYGCEVEYRGIDGRSAPFSQKWLQQNDDPNTGFVLLLTYCRHDPRSDSFSDAWNAVAMPSPSSTRSPTSCSSTIPRTSRTKPGARSSRPACSPSGSFMDDGHAGPRQRTHDAFWFPAGGAPRIRKSCSAAPSASRCTRMARPPPRRLSGPNARVGGNRYRQADAGRFRRIRRQPRRLVELDC